MVDGLGTIGQHDPARYMVNVILSRSRPMPHVALEIGVPLKPHMVKLGPAKIVMKENISPGSLRARYASLAT